MSLQAAALIVAALALVLLTSLRRIPEGQVYSVRRRGRPTRLLLPGLHFLLPLVDHITHKISLAGHTLQVEEPLPTTGGVARIVKGLVYWQVLEPDRADAVIDRADELILRRALDAVCAIEDPSTEPGPTRNARLKQALNQSLRARGMLITRVDLNVAA
ncbi:MAG TPA: SPFH domain-containing protein [Rhodanobacteraceae bacterium]|nr:SPFH domain-containing protein [Rhodanobacteraceae bacterium]